MELRNNNLTNFTPDKLLYTRNTLTEYYNNKIRSIEDDIVESEDDEIVYQKKMYILKHRSYEEITSTTQDGVPKYYSWQEHRDAEKPLINNLRRHVRRNLIPSLNSYIQELNKIKYEIENEKKD